MVSAFAITGTLLLFVLLVVKEVAGSSKSYPMQRLNLSLSVGLFPMLFAFILIFFFSVAEILG